MKIAVYCSSAEGLAAEYYTAAEQFGRLLASHGHSLVYGGYGKGVMAAVAAGVHAGGGAVTGVVPAVFDREGFAFAGCTQVIRTQTMHQRKAAMEAEADAFAVLPGGIGTYDEFFEALDLKGLGLLPKPLAVLNTGGCYDALAALLADGVRRGMIAPRNAALAPMFATAGELLAYLEQQAGRR